jgi:RNA 2',3'-cyclic 3'-phosphodiesterase
MSSMRVFVALNLPPAVRRGLAASLEPLRQRQLPVRWTPEESLHLTLKFLGDIEGTEVPRLRDTLHAVAVDHAPLTLSISGIGAFPSLRRASVLWVGVAPDSPLMALQHDVEIALSRLGYVRDLKPFRPHVTVARTQRGTRPLDAEHQATCHEFAGTAAVATMDLMRSHLSPGGASHEPLLRVRLGTEDV